MEEERTAHPKVVIKEGQVAGPDKGEPQPAASAPASAPVTIKDLYGELLTPINLFMLALAALLGLTGLLGGWDRLGEKQEKLKVVPAGKVMKVEPFELKFKKAYWYLRLEGVPMTSRMTSTGSRALMVTADVTNTSKKPIRVATLQKSLRLTNQGLTSFGEAVTSVEAPPGIFRASDLLEVPAVQPGLSMPVALIWFQDEKKPLPKSLTIRGYKQTYRRSSLSGDWEFFDPTPVAEATLPLTEFKQP